MLIEQIIAGTVYSEVQKQLIVENKRMNVEKVIQMVKKITKHQSTKWNNYNPQETVAYNTMLQ